MSDGSDVIYVYDDTFEGLMTAVFEAYARRPAPESVTGRAHCQQLLGRRYIDIGTDIAKAERVIAGIQRKMGQDSYAALWSAFQSEAIGVGDLLYQYIRLGMAVGPRIQQRITDERVIAVNKLAGLVGREAGLLIEFVRFSKMEGGVYYGEITPQYNVLAQIMPHFAERFSIQPFLIRDKNRQIAGVFDTREWWITSTESMQVPDVEEDERAWRQMWRAFYDTIAIKERVNLNLRRNHMPKKYWKNMTEMIPDIRPDPVQAERQKMPLPSECRGGLGPDGRPVFADRASKPPARALSAALSRNREIRKEASR